MALNLNDNKLLAVAQEMVVLTATIETANPLSNARKWALSARAVVILVNILLTCSTIGVTSLEDSGVGASSLLPPPAALKNHQMTETTTTPATIRPSGAFLPTVTTSSPMILIATEEAKISDNNQVSAQNEVQIDQFIELHNEFELKNRNTNYRHPNSSQQLATTQSTTKAPGSELTTNLSEATTQSVTTTSPIESTNENDNDELTIYKRLAIDSARNPFVPYLNVDSGGVSGSEQTLTTLLPPLASGQSTISTPPKTTDSSPTLTPSTVAETIASLSNTAASIDGTIGANELGQSEQDTVSPGHLFSSTTISPILDTITQTDQMSTKPTLQPSVTPPESSTSLPQARLSDLLHLMEHLNLMQGAAHAAPPSEITQRDAQPPMERDQFNLRSGLNTIAPPEQSQLLFRPIRMDWLLGTSDERTHKSPPTSTTTTTTTTSNPLAHLEAFLASSGSNNQADFSSSPSEANPNQDNDGLNRRNKPQDRGDFRDFYKPTTRFPLISPYSLSFETTPGGSQQKLHHDNHHQGTMQQQVKKTQRDHAAESSTSKQIVAVRNQAAVDRSRHSPTPQVAAATAAAAATLQAAKDSIGRAGATSATATSAVSTHSSRNDGTKGQSANQVRLADGRHRTGGAGGSGGRTKVNTLKTTLNENSKRGERHAVDKTIHEDDKKMDSEHSGSVAEGARKANEPAAASTPDVHKHANEQVAGVSSERRPYSSSQQQQVFRASQQSALQAGDDVDSWPIANGGLSSFDDPHKKSLYYTSEPAGLFAGTDESQILNLPHSNHHTPLTIGQLARQHGVPFRLKSPLAEDYRLGSAASLTSAVDQDHDTPLESGHYEDYVYMPYERDTNAGGGGLGEGLKLDEGLKQRIAMKAFELATKDPELSARLFKTLYASANLQTQVQQQHQPFDLDSANLPLGDAHNSERVVAYDAPAKLYPNLLNAATLHGGGGGGGGNSQAYYTSQSSQMAATNPLSIMLPLASTNFHQESNQDTGYNYSQQHQNQQSGSNVSQVGGGPLNLMVADLADRWALSRMPDLIPIPLAATVPGYLIRLPDGKILAAALTNSFSIQGIQRGPLSSTYRSFLNQRLKNFIQRPTPLLATNNHNGHHASTSKQVATFVAAPPHNFLAAGSGLRPIGVPAPVGANRYVNNQQQKGLMYGKDKGGGLFSARNVLSQLGFGRSSQRNATSTSPSHRKPPPVLPNKALFKSTNSNRFPASALSEQEMAALPIADLNDPVFSFADESQLLDRPDDYHQVALPARTNQVPITASAPLDQADLLESASSLALRARLNQLLSFRGVLSGQGPGNGGSISSGGSLMGDGDFFQQITSKRRSPSPRWLSLFEPTIVWLARRANRSVATRKLSTCNDKLNH